MAATTQANILRRLSPGHLSRSYPAAALEEALAEGAIVGHPDMPEYRFGPENVAALGRYLETIQTQ